jgi:predicted nucleic acid-binding protein
MLPEIVVVHVSALVEILVGTSNAPSIRGRLRGTRAHAPAHVDAEVLACLEGLVATAGLPATVADDAVKRLAAMPLVRHPLVDLVPFAWAGCEASGAADALYLALADRLGAPLVATDGRLATAYPNAEIVAW